MKEVVLKSLFLLSVFLMVDYLIMIIVGCVSGYLDCTANYFDCTYCTIGKSVFGISAILFFIAVKGDFKSMRKNPRSN